MPLTNEKILVKFESQFELVTYAIRLVKNMIQTGRAPRIRTDIQNRSMQILGEIAQGKDVFDKITSEEVLNIETQTKVRLSPTEKKRGKKEATSH